MQENSRTQFLLFRRGLFTGAIDSLECPSNPARAVLPRRWLQTPTGQRLTSIEIPPNLDSAGTTVLGGVCSIFTADWKTIRDQSVLFGDIDDFERWIRSWYPRLDQIYGCVGVPPATVRQICYVVEDSFFAKRLAEFYPQWDLAELTAIFKKVHQELGEPAIREWLALAGYCNADGSCRPVTVVYTSELEKEMAVALKCFERSIGAALGRPFFRFKENDRTKAAINMMYTPYWVDALGLDRTAIVYEPDSHGVTAGNLVGAAGWLAQNPYGEPRGLCAALGKIGYQEFQLATDNLPSRVVRTQNRTLNRATFPDAFLRADSEIVRPEDIPGLYMQLFTSIGTEEINEAQMLSDIILRLRRIWGAS